MKSNKIFFILIFLFVISLSSHSVLFVPYQGRTKKIITDHFVILFPKQYEKTARKTATYAEDIHKKLSDFMKWEPILKTTIIISDHTDAPNGIAVTFFRNTIYGNRGYTNLYRATPNGKILQNNIFKKKELEEDFETITKNKEIQIGNNYDTYPPQERHRKLTRRVLEVFTEYPEWIIHLVTKSPLIANDINLLKKLPNLEVEITITTLKQSEDFERGKTPSVKQRLYLIKYLSDNGIFTRVMIMPVLVGYTDTDMIWKIAKAHGCKDYKIKGLNWYKIDNLKTKYGIK